MPVSMVAVPSDLQTLVVASSDTNAINIGNPSTGKAKIWGLILTGGTSMQIKSAANPLSGVMSTSGLALPLPKMISYFGYAYPYWQANDAEQLSIVPGASGLNGTLYWSY